MWCHIFSYHSSLTESGLHFFLEPGEFSFEQASYHANIITGEVTCDVIRKKGCDGMVTLTYNTMWVNTPTIKSAIIFFFIDSRYSKQQWCMILF